MRRPLALLLGAGGLAAAATFGFPADGAPEREIAAAAQAFLESLDEAKRGRAQFAFDDPERLTWGFVPAKYEGVRLGEMTLEQRRAAHALLRSALSAKGYLKATTIFALDGVLRAIAEAAGRQAAHRDPEHYAFAIFGKPSADGAWGWCVQGHHLSLHFTGAGGELTAHTPAFRGANPAEVRSGPLAGLRALAAEEDLGRRLVRSLDDEQRRIAVIAAQAPADVILGPARDARSLGEPAGLPVARMDDAQRALVAALLDEYATDLRGELAGRELARIRDAGIERIHFAWAGGFAPGEGHYYRLHGPTFVIEYDNTQDGANHIHTVWRDPQRDFGGDPLREHLERDHRKR
jgi:hypothetical protein